MVSSTRAHTGISPSPSADSELLCTDGCARPLQDHAQVAGFDFLWGAWSVEHRKLKDRLAGCAEWYQFPGTLDVSPILGGAGNLDHNLLHDPAGAYFASSLRLFDVRDDHWSIYWLDGRCPAVEPPVIGRFEGAKGTFYNAERLGGRLVRVRTTYEPLTPATAEWTQAFSADEGESWEVNWIMKFTRAQG